MGRSDGPLVGKHVLVTGGAGFIGSTLVDALLERNNHVICYDNLSPYYGGKELNFKHNLENPSYELLRSDILEGAMMKKAANDVDVIFHLAAQPGVRYSLTNPELVTRANVEGTVAVLEAARAAGAVVVFASSSSVYGSPSKLPIHESDPVCPITPYSASKLAAEHFCRSYSELYGLRVIVLRYFTVYGPRQRPDMVVRRFLSQMESNRPLAVFGDGRQSRDLTFVDDIVAGTIGAAETNLPCFEVLNLGAGHRIQLLQLIKDLGVLSGRTVSCKFEEAALGDVVDTEADCSKARRLIGFEPKTGLEQGLLRFIKWYRSGPIGD